MDRRAINEIMDEFSGEPETYPVGPRVIVALCRALLATPTPEPAVEGEGSTSYLKTLRMSLRLTLRDVERITDGRISNSYLSQLENGFINRPSAVMLRYLATVYAVDLVELMTRGGFLTEPQIAPEPAAAPAVGEGATEEAAAADSAFIEADRKHRQAEGGMHTELRDRWFRRGWAAARSYFAPAPAAGLVTAEMVEAACRAQHGETCWSAWNGVQRDDYRDRMSKTLAVALAARQEGGA